MRTWHAVTAAFAAGAIGLALACCGKGDVVPAGDAGTDGGAAPAGACDDFFASVIERCSICPGCRPNVGPAEPASEVARVRARWDAACAAFLALPGLAPDASDLAACASAVEAGGCVPYYFPSCAQDACRSLYGDPGRGTLQAGSTCLLSAQCDEGVCSAGYELPDGGIPICGACVTWTPIGHPTLVDACDVRDEATVGGHRAAVRRRGCFPGRSRRRRKDRPGEASRFLVRRPDGRDRVRGHLRGGQQLP